MKLRKSKLLALFMCVVIIFSTCSFAITANAASWSYLVYQDGSLSLKVYKDTASEIDLSQINNSELYIGIETEAFAECKNLKVISIPENFYQIKEYAVGYIRNGNSLTKVSDFTIKAKTNSAGHEYAVANGFKFISTGTASVNSEHTIVPDANGYCESGLKKYEKLSKAEIAQLVKDPYVSNPDSPYVNVPSVTAPYTLGSIRTEIINSGITRFNAYRRLAGLDSVALSADYNTKAQTAAVVNAANNTMTHFPSQPANMSQDMYETGYAAAGQSNLACYLGYTTKSGPLAFSVDLWMDDSDAYNIAVLGHRRWFLNPAMGKTGFGCANYNSYVHTTAYAFDNSTTVTDYDFISWPPSGNVPNNTEFFSPAHAWSVSINPAKINTWDYSAVTVELTRESDGKKWIFDNVNNSSGGFFNVDTNGYGVSNCIIFRPENISKYEGVYTVKINGLKSLTGNKTTSMSFRVDFFDTNNITETTTAAPTTAPTTVPTTAPTTAPTTVPTTAPTTAPTTVPTTAPTTAPTTVPTTAPTTAPTTVPTTAPTTAPTTVPTTAPTTAPTTVPTTAPTTAPTTVPTTAPTTAPTTVPTTFPTTAPTTALTTTSEQILIMLGDLNNDNRITAADARIALRFSARLETPTDSEKLAADVNKDLRVTAADARLILRVAAHLDLFD